MLGQYNPCRRKSLVATVRAGRRHQPQGRCTREIRRVSLLWSWLSTAGERNLLFHSKSSQRWRDGQNTRLIYILSSLPPLVVRRSRGVMKDPFPVFPRLPTLSLLAETNPPPIWGIHVFLGSRDHVSSSRQRPRCHFKKRRLSSAVQNQPVSPRANAEITPGGTERSATLPRLEATPSHFGIFPTQRAAVIGALVRVVRQATPIGSANAYCT